jgi:cell division initiation protein
MKITPLEIKQQSFEKSLRGYDVADVQAFLTLISNEYEHLLTKNKELEEDIDKLTERVRHYERVEEALHETLQTTKESVGQKMDNARLEAKNLVDKAQMEAEAIIKDANFEKANIRQSIHRLLEKREEIILGISAYLETATQTVQNFRNDDLKVFTLEQEAKSESRHSERNEADEVEEEQKNSDSSTRFAFDEEAEINDSSNFKDDDDSFPPGSDRLNDILDEID